jgi:hypothetical protein
MAEQLKINLDIQDVNWKMLYDRFDSRDGFQRLLFGLDGYEDCELLQQIAKVLNFDLSFIKFPEGRAFAGGLKNEAASIAEFISFLSGFLAKLEQQPDYYQQIEYPYINMQYFSQRKLNKDLLALIEFFKHHQAMGAAQVWFEFEI